MGVMLLDTHAFLWWILNSPELSGQAREAIADTRNTILVSAASAWEITTKVRLGKLPGAQRLASNFEPQLEQEGFQGLSITVDDGLRAGSLPGRHKDPFDRMLIAQTQAHGIPIISNEECFDLYAVRRVW
jgi:PIN domain nuclease of toxin-antitoxin system